jgi:hypothetical protein
VVVVSRNGFDPPQVEIDRGDQVTFHRRDAGPGTYKVVSEDAPSRAGPSSSTPSGRTASTSRGPGSCGSTLTPRRA